MALLFLRVLIKIRKAIPEIFEDGGNTLSPDFRDLLRKLYEEMVHFDKRIDTMELKLGMRMK